MLIIVGLIFGFFLKLNKVLRHHSKTLKAIFPKPGTEQLRIRPLGCTRFLKNVRNGRVTAVKDPNHGELILVKNATDKFIVSIHKQIVDDHSRGWSIMETGEYYPTRTTALMREILANTPKPIIKDTNEEKPPEEDGGEKSEEGAKGEEKEGESSESTSSGHRFMEVGASFGWFSLLAHKLGYQVDVFEPNLVNVIRICQSLEANKWTNHEVDVYPYGVTAEDSAVLFQYHEDGTARINDNWGHKSQAFALDSFARERGWLERNDEVIQVLKIDVGNHVPHVLSGATELLASGMVKALILDLTIRHKGDKKQCIEAIQQLMDANYELELWGEGDVGPGYPSPWPHNAELPSNIIKAMERPKHHWEMTFYWKYKGE
jgi:FkbM family methyltransferase